MALDYLMRRIHDDGELLERRKEPRLGPEQAGAASEVFDLGGKTIVDCAHVRVERLDTNPALFSKVFKEFEDRKGQKYDYRYWAERENYFLREFLKKQSEFTHVVQARHLISENDAAKQVLTCDAGITVANWLRVKSRYEDTATLSHPFQRSDAFLRLIRACLVALKQIHAHRIVHCDIKEDNICLPYAPRPFPGRSSRIHLEFGKLKLIDFAFSVAHAIPLTQILVINPDERVPYQSELLIAALHSDRRSGSPNAVQQLDYRVDLFSLGYMAEKIGAAGLDCPPGPGAARALEDIHALVRKLKACDTAPAEDLLPHDGLIAEIDRLLLATAGMAGPAGRLDFHVDGEWTEEEMSRGRGTGRKTPLTPVALPVPTPVSLPLGPMPALSRSLSGKRVPLLLGLALACAAGWALLRSDHGGMKEATPPAPPGASAELKQAAPVVAPPAPKPVVDPAIEPDRVLNSPAPQAVRAKALRELAAMAKAGSGSAAQRIAVFENRYDEVKPSIARSAWWARGQGAAPEQAARWLEDASLLAEIGDRPAMLDLAFSTGHGRGLQLDRVSSVQTYLKVFEQARGADENSARIRQSAARGLASVMNVIIEHKDRDSAKRLSPALIARAESGAADAQYHMGLLNECVAQPANLAAARQWYRKAAEDPAWKRTADQKARLLGRWCPSA